MPTFPFQQVDVFSAQPMRGNPLAVVIGADGLSDAEMQSFANWTNLSETTFLLRPTDPKAHYRVRIFTPTQELPFAGHPTLGSAQVWLSQARDAPEGEIVQECGAGLVRIRRDGSRLAFAAPPLTRSGAVDPELVDKIARGIGLPTSMIKASNWCENGPDWIGVLLPSRADVLAVRPTIPSSQAPASALSARSILQPMAITPSSRCAPSPATATRTRSPEASTPASPNG